MAIDEKSLKNSIPTLSTDDFNKPTEEKTESPAPTSAAPHENETVLTLRRTAKETKKYVVIMRCFAIAVIIISVIISLTYAFSYFYDKYGSFTVKLSKYDMIRQGLSLSETPDYDRSISVLNADIIYDITNISGKDLPDNVDKINGSHNGENYIAYTFYLINSGEDTLTYEGSLNMKNISGGIDEAIRVAVYKNGEKTVYGKTKSNGGGKEKDCDSEFASASVVMTTKHEDFKPQAKDKYTIVIRLEGNDPDCTDDIIGGKMKMSMDFKIIEDT